MGRSSFVTDLRSVLSERDFRRLFATRLISQAGDGVFNAGFAAYAFFSAQTFPNPAAAVDAFAVLYLPYSLIGPFAGVLIDRWPRRQILVWSALIRAGMVALTGFEVASGELGLPLYISALAVLGVNRFFLSSVSAGVPHVVRPDKLVMANAVAPTSGTIIGFIGGVAGLGVHVITGGGHTGSAATLLFGGVCYVVAALLGTRMARGLLGPHHDPAVSHAGSIAGDLAVVARGMLAGLRHLGARRRGAYALGVITVHRILYGVLLVLAVLLYRNYFYPASNGNAALGHATLLVIASAFGYGLAALVTPPAVHRLGRDTWIIALMAGGGIIEGVLGVTFSQVAFLGISFALGVSAQGVKICVDTTVQREMDDAYLGRGFSLYDMLYNVAFVAGPAVAAPFMPVTGKSYPLVVIVAAGYLAAAAVYAILIRGPAAQPAPGAPAGGGQIPSPAAQRKSS